MSEKGEFDDESMQIVNTTFHAVHFLRRYP